MAIKQVFKIKDEILNDEYEVSGQSGVLYTPDSNLFLIDTCQLAQVIIETCAKEEGDDIIIKEQAIGAMSIQISREISDKILDNIFENAMSDAEDDEEIILIKRGE